MKNSEIRIYRLLTSLELLSKRWLIAIAIGTVFIVGYTDYVTGIELSLSLFYLIPITMAAWALGKNAGLNLSVLCATTWLITNLLAGLFFTNIFIGIWNTFIRFGFYATVTVLLAELRNALEEESLLANTDPLTGAMNRRSFNDIAEKKMIIAEVNRRTYTMVYVDLDNFKAVNDTLGHAIGDLVLKSVVDTLNKQIRSTDLLARLGGDEFAILLTEIDQEQAKPIVERLQLSLLEDMRTNNWNITFSIGVLTVLSMPESADKLVTLTDALMYEVKSKGKNAIHYSTFNE
jgi:diguanylate cyclase (GGDEF)-like protein